MIRCVLKHGPMGYTLLFSRNGKSGVEADAEENEVSDSDSDLDLYRLLLTIKRTIMN